jgi:TBC1 domain family protein 5
MHELLAPLVYVLHMDILHLARVRERYEDPFQDQFDAPVEESITHNRRGGQQRTPSKAALNDIMFTDDEDWVHRVYPEDIPLVKPDEFGFNLKTMVLGSDSYGAEGELGALLSGRFMEHDAYCMLDSLLTGCKGSEVVLADYFTSSKEGNGGLSPVLEASGAIYNTLAAVDLPLYIHLVGLGVEPQFFSLRWLRVLFVREFDLEKVLLVWDAIFSAKNSSSEEVTDASMTSPRSSFISNFAISMMLYLRPILLAASNATSCLQKLLNFPKNVDVRILIENAKMLRILSQE